MSTYDAEHFSWWRPCMWPWEYSKENGQKHRYLLSAWGCPQHVKLRNFRWTSLFYHQPHCQCKAGEESLWRMYCTISINSGVTRHKVGNLHEMSQESHVTVGSTETVQQREIFLQSLAAPAPAATLALPKKNSGHRSLPGNRNQNFGWEVTCYIPTELCGWQFGDGKHSDL